MLRINWVMQIVEKKTQTDQISADPLIIAETSVGDQFQKRAAISHKDGWDRLLKIGRIARLANKFTKGKMYNKHTMHPNDPTQTISPLKEDSIWTKKSPPHPRPALFIK